MTTTHEPARVNGVALHEPGARPDEASLRQLACMELLRQRAHDKGIPSTTPEQGIEALLEAELSVPEPQEQACRRYFAAHAAQYARGERVRLRHILFAVTSGVPVAPLRDRAEALLLELRCADPEGDAFGKAAGAWSNCPTGAQGGDLGWLTREDCAPEFGAEVFGQATVGVLPRLVHSRFGFHVVEVLAREPGIQPPFEDVAQAVAMRLRQQAWTNAVRQYLQRLAAGAKLEGVALSEADGPLVQ